jgi:hypothetical protein
MFSVRYGLPAVLVLVGIGLGLFSNRGAEAFALFAGAGLSILLLNYLFRYGVKGDEERQVEESARDQFTATGEWPDEEKKAGRKWSLPENVATPESEAAEAAARERESTDD